MVGVVGNQVFAAEVDALSELAELKNWQNLDAYSHLTWDVGVITNGEKDPGDHTVIEHDDGVVVISGVIRNWDRLAFGPDDLPERLSRSPVETLQSLNGSFQLAAVTGETLLLASDPLASRPLYVTADGTTFSPSVSALASDLDTCTLDQQSLVELLRYDLVLSHGTLANEISQVPPGTFLTIQDGECEQTRYHRLDFVPTADEYVESVYNQYRESVKRSLASVSDDQDIGLFLTGGLDSRLLAHILRDLDYDFATYTHDSNPRDGSNVAIADRLATELGVPNETTPMTPEGYARNLEQAVTQTGGIFSWIRMRNLPYNFHTLSEETDVLVEAVGQGELFGEDIFVEELASVRNGSSPLNVYHSKRAGASKATVERVLTLEDGIDCKHRLRELAESSPYARGDHVLIDLHHQSFYPEYHYQRLFYRDRVGMRVPLVDTKLLEFAATMPSSYRRKQNGHVFGKAMDPMSPLKLVLVKEHASTVASVPYERTDVPPKYPMRVHLLRKIPSDVLQMVLGRFEKQRGGMYADWYRTSEELQDTVYSYLTDAMEREFFDREALDDLHTAHVSGEENNLKILSAVSTAEIWMQNYLDA